MLRSSRPAAAASLPALLANGQGNIITQHQPPPNPYANGNGHVHANGHAAAYAPTPQPAAGGHAAIPMPAHDGSQPILPPRPTGRMYATSSAPGTSWWKSWPLIVIVLAGLAIVSAVVLMVLPVGASADKGVIKDKGSLAPPPAPERMDTNPLPPNQPAPPRSGDPWSNGGTQGKTDPLPKRSPDIDIPDDPDPGVGTPPGGSLGGINGTGAMMMAMMGHACSRAASCGALDSTLKQYCELTKMPAGTPPTCAAAKRCLQHIDEVDCSTKFDDLSALQSVTYKFQDCVEAMSC